MKFALQAITPNFFVRKFKVIVVLCGKLVKTERVKLSGQAE